MDGACSGVTCGSLIGCDSLQVISVVPNTSFWLPAICKPLKPPCTPVSILHFLGFLLPVYAIEVGVLSSVMTIVQS